MTKRLYTMDEISKLVDYYPHQVYDFINSGKLKARVNTRRGRRMVRLVERTDLYEFLMKQPTQKAQKTIVILLDNNKREYDKVLEELYWQMREDGIIKVRFDELINADPITLLYEREL